MKLRDLKKIEQQGGGKYDGETIVHSKSKKCVDLSYVTKSTITKVNENEEI